MTSSQSKHRGDYVCGHGHLGITKQFCWSLVFVVQLWFVSEVAMQPINPVMTSYQQQERAAAFKAQEESPSPATRAIVQDELRRAAQHISRRHHVLAGMLLAVFLALDIGSVYGLRYLRRATA